MKFAEAGARCMCTGHDVRTVRKLLESRQTCHGEALQKLHAGLEEMRAHLRLVLSSTCDGCGFEARTSKQTGSSGSTKRRDLGTIRAQSSRIHPLHIRACS